MIVAAGLIDENSAHGSHFYEFTGTEFKHIKTIPVARNQISTMLWINNRYLYSNQAQNQRNFGLQMQNK